MAEEIQPGGDGGDSTQQGFAWQRIDLHFHQIKIHFSQLLPFNDN